MGMVGQRVVNGVWQKVVQWMLRKQMVQRVDGRLKGRWGAGSNGGIPFDGWGEGGPPIPLSVNVKF